MQFRFLILFLLAVLVSCQDIDRMEKPKDLIPKEKMADILVELSLLQGAKSSNRKMLEEKGIHPSDYLWKRFDIDSMQFVESNNYYSENFDDYRDIYQVVQQRLEVLRDTYDSLMLIEQRKEDSIRALDPEDSLERARELQFRDSILQLRVTEGDEMPQPVSIEDTIQ